MAQAQSHVAVCDDMTTYKATAAISHSFAAEIKFSSSVILAFKTASCTSCSAVYVVHGRTQNRMSGKCYLFGHSTKCARTLVARGKVPKHKCMRVHPPYLRLPLPPAAASFSSGHVPPFPDQKTSGFGIENLPLQGWRYRTAQTDEGASHLDFRWRLERSSRTLKS